MPKTLAEKLRLQAGHRALAINAPKDYLAILGDLPEGVELTLADSPKEGVTYDWTHLYVLNSTELARLAPLAVKSVVHDGLLWISYPKRSAKAETDLSRDVFWTSLSDYGLRPVTQISVDATWSALRFRPSDKVGR